ncbi:MAG: hypothetical protein V4668_00245 [Patescibacteria group bacterium]
MMIARVGGALLGYVLAAYCGYVALDFLVSTLTLSGRPLTVTMPGVIVFGFLAFTCLLIGMMFDYKRLQPFAEWLKSSFVALGIMSIIWMQFIPLH